MCALTDKINRCKELLQIAFCSLICL